MSIFGIELIIDTMGNIKSQFMTTKQASEHLGISGATINNLRKTNQLPAYKIGNTRDYLYKMEDLNKLVTRV